MPKARKLKSMKYGGYEVTYPAKVPVRAVEKAVDAVADKYRYLWQFYFDEYQPPSKRYNTWDLFGSVTNEDGETASLGVTNIDTSWSPYYKSGPLVELGEIIVEEEW